MSEVLNHLSWECSFVAFAMKSSHTGYEYYRKEETHIRVSKHINLKTELHTNRYSNTDTFRTPCPTKREQSTSDEDQMSR